MVRSIFRAGPQRSMGSIRHLRRAAYILALVCGTMVLSLPLVRAAQADSALSPETIETPAAGSGTETPAPVAANTASASAPAQIPAAKPEKAAHDLSPMGMFLAADPVVKAVMIILAAASVVTWTILLVKMFSLGSRLNQHQKAMTAARASAEAKFRASLS
jgi:biopolymer transport protein ExbB